MGKFVQAADGTYYDMDTGLPATETLKNSTQVPTTTIPTDPGLFGLSNSQIGGIGTLGGLAMKAIALPGQMDYYNTQTDLAKQQLASNNENMANKRTFNANWSNASNGLARSMVG